MKLSKISMGMAVRCMRDTAKLTLSQLSEATGIPVSSLSRTENGLRALDFAEAVAICEAVGLDVGALRLLAETFEREGVAEKQRAQAQLSKDLNDLQRLALQTAIAAHSSK